MGRGGAIWPWMAIKRMPVVAAERGRSGGSARSRKTFRLSAELADWIGDCRDPKDNKYLELASAGGADAIWVGDMDFTALHPWGVS